MQSRRGLRAEKIVVVGGATRNAFWMQNKADVLGRPIEVPEVEDATPLGAAILAGIGVGIYKDEKDAYEHVRRDGATYTPDPARHRALRKSVPNGTRWCIPPSRPSATPFLTRLPRGTSGTTTTSTSGRRRSP